MAFRFTVVNLPPEAKYWAAQFDIEGQEYWLGVLTEECRFQTYPIAGNVDAFHCFLYDSNGNYLGPAYGKSLYYGGSVTENGSYQFDWATNQFKGLASPRFSNLGVDIIPDYISPGDYTYVFIDFDYSGPDIVGALAIEVAIGRQTLFSFTEIEPPLVKGITIYGTTTHEHYDWTYQSLTTIPIGYYALRVAIGNYPWDGTIYARKSIPIRVLAPEGVPEEPPNGEPPNGEPPNGEPPNGEASDLMPWILLGGGVVMGLVALGMKKR